MVSGDSVFAGLAGGAKEGIEANGDEVRGAALLRFEKPNGLAASVAGVGAPNPNFGVADEGVVLEGNENKEGFSAAFEAC